MAKGELLGGYGPRVARHLPDAPSGRQEDWRASAFHHRRKHWSEDHSRGALELEANYLSFISAASIRGQLEGSAHAEYWSIRRSGRVIYDHVAKDWSIIGSAMIEVVRR